MWVWGPVPSSEATTFSGDLCVSVKYHVCGLLPEWVCQEARVGPLLVGRGHGGFSSGSRPSASDACRVHLYLRERMYISGRSLEKERPRRNIQI